LSLVEHRAAPARRESEYHRAAALVHRGPFAARLRWIGLGLGTVAPLLLLVLSPPAAWTVAAVLALIGLYVTQDVLVRAGQAPAIS